MRRSFVPPPDATSSPDDPASIDPASKEKPPPSLSVQDLSTGRYPTMNAHLLPDNGSASTLSLLSLPEEMEHRHGRFSSVMSLTESEAPVSRTAEAKSNKAFRIAEEIASSERVFVDCLQLICADFRAAASNDLPQVELDRILSYLPHLCNLNQNLLSDFELRLQNWASNPRISDVIVRKGPFLKLYSAYIRDYSSQMDLLSECIDRYPAFGKTLKEFEMTERCKKLSLRHYMLKPVQRMPQYRLLLDNYLSNLEPDSIDYVDTLAALKVVTEVADHANNSFKIKDKFQMLLQLQSRVSNCEIVKPGRIIIKEGELNKVSRKMLQPRYFILFNDSLIYTSYVGSPSVSSGLKLHHELPLLRMEVRLPAAANSDTDFNVISTARSFTLAASSVQVRDEWMSALNQAINEYQSNLSTFEIAQNLSPSTELHFGQQAPIWIPDSRATMCQLCTAAFTVTYRRHHCRACGKVICKSCSSNKVALEYLKFRSARVCDECYALASDFYCRIDGPGNKSELNERGAILEKEMDSSSCSSAADAGSLTPSSFVGAFSYTLGKRKDRLPGRKERKNIPERLMEVRANDTGSQMSGYLSRQIRRTWKKNWFVLKDRVLYRYKASEDVAALDAIPVLGYTIDIFRLPDGGDAEVEFHLCHTTQPPHIFQAETATIARRWVQELSLATVL